MKYTAAENNLAVLLELFTERNYEDIINLLRNKSVLNRKQTHTKISSHKECAWPNKFSGRKYSVSSQ
jgi:hypothetical protein